MPQSLLHELSVYLTRLNVDPENSDNFSQKDPQKSEKGNSRYIKKKRRKANICLYIIFSLLFFYYYFLIIMTMMMMMMMIFMSYFKSFLNMNGDCSYLPMTFEKFRMFPMVVLIFSNDCRRRFKDSQKCAERKPFKSHPQTTHLCDTKNMQTPFIPLIDRILSND